MLILEFGYKNIDPFAFRRVMGDTRSIWDLWWELKNISASHYGKPTSLHI